MTFCLKLTCSPSPWMAVQMTVLLNRKLYLLETVFREKLSQDLCEPQSTSSEDMFAFLNEKLNENYLTNHMSKFVGFGCDGASNIII